MNQLSSNNQRHSLSFNKLQKRIRHNTGKAIADFNMIEDGDKVKVCLSGGNECYIMLDMSLHMQKVAPVSLAIPLNITNL